MIYLDTGILVRALLKEHPNHSACERLVDARAISSCHSLAEVFNTLTGFFQLPNQLASRMVESLAEAMRFEVISQSDYMRVIREARQRGVQGGIVYDAIHGEIARRLKVEKIVSYNLSNLRHVAPDILVEVPRRKLPLGELEFAIFLLDPWSRVASLAS